MPESPRKCAPLLPGRFNAEGAVLRAAGRAVTQGNAILTPPASAGVLGHSQTPS